MSLHAYPRARKALLCHAIGMALAAEALAVQARDLNPGQQLVVDAGTPPDSYRVTQNGKLTLNPGASTLNIELSESMLFANSATIASTVNATSDVALRVTNGSAATLTGGSISSQYGIGLAVVGVGGARGGDLPASATLNGASVSGGTSAATVANGSMLVASGSSLAGIGENGVGVLVANGTAKLTQGTHASGTVNGAVLQGDTRGGDVPANSRELIVDGAIVEGRTQAAVRVAYGLPNATAATLQVLGGGQLVGNNGIAVDIDGGMHLDATVSGSTVTGDIEARTSPRGAATADIALGDKGVLVGAMNGAIDASIATTGVWQITRDSTIHSLDLAGQAAFAPRADGTHGTLTLTGDFTGGGMLGFNTVMNEGGALGSQATDRVLINGNVTGTTRVVVTPTGDGALTDSNHNGAVDASEGISLIQVAGSSRADAFVLAGTYVAAGPYQYTLHAFGPGTTDGSQSLLSGGAAWDYRLGNRYVTDCGDACPPVDPVPEPGLDPEPEPGPDPVDRVAIVPQLPSYMLAPMALQNFGNALNDGLHQRLGEIRDSVYGANAGGEVFARYIGSQLNYSRNLSFQRYGYDFDQQINALQVGAGIVAVDTDQGSIRAGWALDHGTTRVTPSAADGNSRAKYYANGGAAWVTYQHGNGLWVDGVLGVTRYHGDVSTDLRGDEVGKLHAMGWTMSVEVGKPLPLGGDWTVEPQFQLRLQQLNFRDFRDKDGLDIRLGNSVQATTRLGVQVGRTANPRFAPYGRLDLIHTSNGNPSISASSEAWNAGDTFQTGRTGNSYRVAAGLTSQLTDHVQLYGEGNWQHHVGGYGLRGWAANAGVRVTF